MKFKKVEIQAFRAYQKVEDGTFDFEVNSETGKDIADFISIYAPNGFGKTSFYDAVEFGITNSIDRFLKNRLPRDIASNERALKKNSGGQKILRNRYVIDDNTPSEVRLYTTNSDKPIINKVPDAKRKNSKDFHFDDNQVKNKYFQTVILSQEWIDAFLKVDDPKERYEKFMTYFGDTETGEYYKKVVNLLSANEKEIEELKQSLQWVQKEINFEVDKDILKKVNNKISELNKDNESLKLVDDSFTEFDSIELSNVITEKIANLESVKNTSAELIQFIDIVFSGNDSIISVDAYFDSVEKKSEVDNKIKGIVATQNEFKKRNNLIAENKNIDTKRQGFFKTDESLNELIKSFASYEAVLKKIQKNESEIEEAKKSKNTLNDDVKNLKLEASELQTNITKTQDEIKSVNTKLQECKELYKKTTDDKEKRTGSIDNLKKKKDDAELLSKQSQLIKLEIDNLQKAIKDLENKQLPSKFEKEFLEYKEAIIELEKIQENIKNEEGKLNKLNQEIKEQKKLTKDIEEFITKGAELIDKAHSSVCPLCSYEYKSYNELSAKIYNNKFLSQKQSELLKSRSDVESVLNDLKKSFNEKLNLFQSSLQKSLVEKKKEYDAFQEKLSTNNEVIKNIEAEIKTYQDELDKLNTILNGIAIESYEKKISESILNSEKDVKSKINSLKKVLESLVKKQSEIKGIESSIEILRKSIDELKSDKTYKAILEYFNREFSNENISLELLNRKQKEITEEINHYNSEIQKISTQIKELDNTLKTTNEELLNKELSVLNEQTQTFQRNIVGFKRSLNTKLGLTIDEHNKDTLKVELEKTKKEQLLNIDRAKQKTLNFNLLKELKQNVEPFLKYQKAKKKEADIIKQKQFLEKNVKPLLENEKQKVSDYLDNQISSFFYEELINDLYKRIDPHPDYKRLKFICDFKDDKPKLNVCLYKDDIDEDPIIPNLYFSTAQLNILSLSIFLAKALNAKDDKGNPIESIFIDDPIQSMDSINILSTIDLFRGIVVNQEKQIILSTHDENFHNLLKKKMPSGLFKSKFMELETFGKVKNEE